MEDESRFGAFKGALVALLIEGTVLVIVTILIKIYKYMCRKEVI